MSAIRTVLWKEWLELRGEYRLWVSALLPPLIFAVMPLILLRTLSSTTDADIRTLGMVLNDPSLRGLSDIELGQAVIGKQFSTLMLLTPLLVPSIIAPYSIVGEKKSNTLEPLLATPIAVWQLLLAKSLAAVIPAIVITWLGAAIFVGGVAAIVASPLVLWAIITPGWLLLLGLCAPVIALLMVALCIAISSRVSDPRTAQQLASVAIVPLMIGIFAQLAGALVLTPALALLATLVAGALAAIAIWVATRVFQRESILTRLS